MNAMQENPRPAVARCPACGSARIAARDVLWPELVSAWELSGAEAAYINRQQGTHCLDCGNNLRMMALAGAITRTQRFDGTLAQLCDSAPALRVLEIDTAGFLTRFLRKLPGHRLVEYPAYDMMDLDIEAESFDLVLHSDSLEHVADPVKGLAECRRVLAPGGLCLFTVPMVVGRMTRSRAGLPPVFHGNPRTATDDQLVRNEFGADAWRFAIEAGFASCAILDFDYPAAVTFVAARDR
jgi:SAM-dependent methyltransferase